MLTLYLACLMFGGVLIAVSILGVGEANGHDFAADAHFDSHFDVAAHGEGLSAAAQFLSFRNLVFFCAFFGLTGSVLSLLAIPSLLSLSFALGLGMFAATTSHKIMSYLKRTESGAEINLQDLEGLKARVTINVSKTRRGKISVVANDRTLQLLSLVVEEAEQEEFGAGASVTIVKVEGGIAHVAGDDFIK